MRRVICFLLALGQASAWAAIDQSNSNILDQVSSQAEIQKGSVYLYGDQSLDVLMPIRVLGAVQKAGVYHVPEKIDLVTLISIAGGTTEKALLSDITIKRKHGGVDQVITVNLEENLSEQGSSTIKLEREDTVMIPIDRSLVSDNTLRIFTIITGAAGIFSSLVIGLTALNK